MNYLERLLDGAEVEWKPLGELGELVRGNGLPKKDFTETGVPAIHYGQIYTYYGLSTISTISFVSPEKAQYLKKVNPGDVVITNTSENIEDVGTPLVYLGKEQAVTGGHATIFKPNKNTLGMYFAYFSQTPAFEKSKRIYAKGTKVIDISAIDLSKIPIPIPCLDNPIKSLAIQAEIVRILDTFTELTAELTARKKQYNHYRDQLLNFDDISPWGGVIKPLGEMAEIKRGTSITKKNVKDGVIPVIAGGRTPAYFHNLSNRKGQTIVIAGSGAYAGYVTWWEQPIFVSDAFTVKPFAGLMPKYCFYWLQGKQQMLHKMKKGVGVPHVYPRDVAQLPIQIPHPNDPEKSLSEQARIVSIIDKFDDLTNSISTGLPREIELRQKQYEYYRDQLLNFPIH